MSVAAGHGASVRIEACGKTFAFLRNDARFATCHLR